jgi:glycine/D-amino acid oxidase-like deaminating enzyme
MTTTADAVVVGAGIIGASVALELARSGRQVLCVDKAGGPGLGSTSASSAIVRFNYSTRDGVALAWEAKHGWESWADHLGAADGEQLARFRRTGLVMLDTPLAPRAPVLRLFDDVGVPYEEWDAATVRRRVPALDPGRFGPPKSLDDEAFWADADGELGAFFTPDAGYVDDPQLAARNLADAAQRLGAQLRFGRRVTAVLRASGEGAADRVTGLTLSDGEQVDAPVVVNCAGPWSGALNALAGVGADFTVGVRPLRQEVHHVGAPPGYGDGERPGPVVADLDLGVYLRGAPGAALLIGGTEPDCDPLEWVDDPDDVDVHPTVPVFRAQVTRAARRLPALTVPDRPTGVAGVYDAADDWTPVYDRTDLGGYYVAMGTSGNQFKNAPAVGALMTALVDAVESGHDHDSEPVTWRGPRTGQPIGLGTFSRRRTRNAASTGTVLG